MGISEFRAKLRLVSTSMPFKLLIHGGAGTILPSAMTTDLEFQYRAGLKAALSAGYQILSSGGSALLAVESAVRVLEDNPLFNAGKGAVFTHDKRHEMDASIMDGKTLQAGAVAGVRNVKNPINLALKVMRESDHVFLMGEGAEKFASQHGVKLVESSYFYTDFRYQQLLQIIDSNKAQLDHNVSLGEKNEGNHKYGTVGAVALDQDGNLAAATSTGGLTNKKFGRVGDSPVIGAGTYANNATCAISATGQGETFIRFVVAHDIAARMEYKGISLQQACQEVIDKIHLADPECGGVIAIDAKGNHSFCFNTPGMYRGVVGEDGKGECWIYRDGFPG
jgi:beta-aspartyl-peptidase (threonine type)